MIARPARRALRFLLFPLSLAGGPAWAQDEALQQCLAIPDITERVACYDALARARQGSTAEAPRASAQRDPPRAADPAPPAPDPRREFGLNAAEREAARAQTPAQLDDLTVVIASIQSRGMGYWQFTTDAGITWRLAEASRSFRPPRQGDAVKIRRGRLGSYYLEAGGQPSMRVVRAD